MTTFAVSQSTPATSASKESVSGLEWLKIIYFLVFTAFLAAVTVYLVREFLIGQPTGRSSEILYETAYEQTNWKGFGQVFEPLVSLPIHYPNLGYQSETFLLDSGALVTSLPRERAVQLGLSLAMLPRTTFSGYGNTTTFAYKSNLTAQLAGEDIDLPVVFTEAAGTKPILGRSGFFEKYNVTFNAKAKKIIISK